MMKDAGIVYVATKDERYVAEAFLSATSIKDLIPEMPVTLFTNLENSVFAQDDCFDTVIPIGTIKRYNSQWSEGQLDRILCLPKSPYRYTLHLDTDTRVRSPEVSEVFACLENHDIAMVECAPDASVSRHHYGRPMFNVGFILYRQSGKVNDLLTEWGELTAEYFGLANCEEVPEVDCLPHISDPELRRKLLFMDQTSMVQLLSPEVNRFGLDLKILDESWNFRGAAGDRKLDQPLKVDHQPMLRNLLGRDIINVALRYQATGNPRRALAVLNSLLVRSPNDTGLMKMIANCHMQNGEFKSAGQIIMRALAIQPADKDLQAALATARARD